MGNNVVLRRCLSQGVVERVSDPILVITYQSKQEQDEQKGFQAILEGLCNMFRNPEAHKPKIEWPVSEQDALEMLSLISYCHRRLDNARIVASE